MTDDCIFLFFRKKLKSTVCKHFNIPEDNLEEFLCHRPLSQLKVITHSNDIVKIYCAQDVAIVFEFKGKFYPTIFMLWSFPNIVPRLKIDKNGRLKLKSASELTIKNVTSVNDINVLGSLLVDQSVCLSSDTSKKIIAVGYMIINGDAIKEHVNDQEKSLKVLHYHEDELFKSLIMKIIPGIISRMEREYNNAPESCDNIPVQIEDTQTSVEKMDELLMTCSLKALKHSITKDMLPVLASTFYKKYVMSFCPEGTELDIKKTSFKKLSTFLQLLDKERIITFNNGSNGIAEITRIILNNSKFQDENLEDNPEQTNADQFSPPVKEIYVVTPGLNPIFSEFLCRYVNSVNKLYYYH